MIATAARIAAILAEALALYVVAEWFASGFREGEEQSISAFALCFTALVAFWLPRIIQGLDLERRPAAIVTGVTAFVVIYGILRIEFAGDFALWDFGWVADFLDDAEETLRTGVPVMFATLFLVAVWVRSTMRSVDDIELETMARSVGLPFIVVTAVLILAAAGDRTAEVARAGAAFYACAVLALALSQLALSGATFGELRAGGTTLILLAATAGATIVCVIVFWILFSILAPVIGPPLGDVTEAVLTVVLYPIAWVMEKIARFIFSGAGLENLDITGPIQEGAEEAGNGDEDETSTAERAGLFLLRGLALVIVLAAVAGVIAWYTRFRKRQRSPELAPGERASSGGLGHDLRDLFRFGRGRSRPAGAVPSSPAVALYRDVLAAAERTGLERAPAQTAEDLAPRLQTLFPAAATDEITLLFEEARYAGREPSSAEVAAAAERWRAHSAVTNRA